MSFTVEHLKDLRLLALHGNDHATRLSALSSLTHRIDEKGVTEQLLTETLFHTHTSLFEVYPDQLVKAFIESDSKSRWWWKYALQYCEDTNLLNTVGDRVCRSKTFLDHVSMDLLDRNLLNDNLRSEVASRGFAVSRNPLGALDFISEMGFLNFDWVSIFPHQNLGFSEFLRTYLPLMFSDTDTSSGRNSSWTPTVELYSAYLSYIAPLIREGSVRPSYSLIGEFLRARFPEELLPAAKEVAKELSKSVLLSDYIRDESHTMYWSPPFSGDQEEAEAVEAWCYYNVAISKLTTPALRKKAICKVSLNESFLRLAPINSRIKFVKEHPAHFSTVFPEYYLSGLRVPYLQDLIRQFGTGHDELVSVLRQKSSSTETASLLEAT